MEITVASPHCELLYLGYTLKVQSVNICLLFHPLTMLHEESIRVHLKSRFRTYGKQMNTPIFSWHIDLWQKLHSKASSYYTHTKANIITKWNRNSVVLNSCLWWQKGTLALYQASQFFCIQDYLGSLWQNPQPLDTSGCGYYCHIYTPTSRSRKNNVIYY
jgi:hypothetical protein